MTIPIILSGGYGKRLWPLSSEEKPKQFHKLFNDKTLLQNTVERAQLISRSKPIVVTNYLHRYIVKSQLHSVGAEATIILEPEAKNTAAAIATAAIQAINEHGDCWLLIMPADHVIKDVSNLSLAINECRSTNKDKIFTFGIKPTYPETGYGYIKLGKKYTDNIFSIYSFTEKPNYELASEYINSGQYVWNSGIFLMRAKTVLKEYLRHCTDIYNRCYSAIKYADTVNGFIYLNKTIYSGMDSISFDYAIMERTKIGAVIATNLEWSDIGSWKALWDISDKTEEGNVVKGDILLNNVSDSFIMVDTLTALSDVENVVVINKNGVILVVDKDKSNNIKRLLQ